MMRATLSPGDRLSLTLFIATILHALVILGVGFGTGLTPPSRQAPVIEITLAQQPSATVPKEYDYLAQANQDGGGDNQQRERPRQASPAPADGVPEGNSMVDAAPRPTSPAPARQEQVVTARESPLPSPAEQLESTPDQAQPTAVDLVNASRQIARSSALQEDESSPHGANISKRRVDARTKEHHAAAYLQAWMTKVEQLGNLNYPDEARRRRLSGSLILEVALWPNGTLQSVRILKPSPHAVLNEAAIRTVRLAAPYAPVPPEVLQGNDLLVITRTWEYVDQTGMATR